MSNFFPAYMDKSEIIGQDAEFRYNAEYSIGMLYVKDYKKNPIHIDDKVDLISKAKTEYRRIKELLKDSNLITSKKNGTTKSSRFHKK